MESQLLLFFFVCLFFATKVQSQLSTISKGSTLYTNSTPNFWSSPSGHYAFGFYPNGNGFKVGIWLVGGPYDTVVVWTAARDDPVLSPGASIIFSLDGRLLLQDSLGLVKSISKADLRAASLASMLNTGDFVLYDSTWRPVWSSFDYPTNTLLVGQKLAKNMALYSSVSETDHSSGNFKLLMQVDANLNALPVNSFEGTKYGYWSSETWSTGKNVSLNLAADGMLYLQNFSEVIVKRLTDGGHPVNNTFFYRATFDVDGILRLYQHQIGTSGRANSSILWAAIKKEDRCQVKGICGLNSYCTINGAGIACLCPPGFDFVDPKQTNKGCNLNFTAEKDHCSSTNKLNTNYTISYLANTAWEQNDFDILTEVSEEACSNGCLDDCFCVVAMHRDQICYKQKLPLRYGKKNSSHPTKTLVKVKTLSLLGNPSTDTNVFITTNTKKLGKEVLIVGVVLIFFSLVFSVSSGYLMYTHRIWSYKLVPRQAISSNVTEDINLRSFSYAQLAKATENFKEELGKGASGRVYKGTLADNNGKEIAVKRLEKMVEDGEHEFRNEMKIIGRTHHKNLVHLIGFCSEGSNRLLVYEFMKNGSLGNHLFNQRNRLTWTERLRILLEIAKGIHYLHEECDTRIIHCDIKPHNILMDESLSAKISDFGLSKLLKPDQTRTYTVPRGTRGYEAPEWHKNNTPITVKADVYSFGIVLLEIICCRKNMDFSAAEEEIILLDWVYKCYNRNEVGKIVGEEEGVDMDELENAVKVGLWCVQTELTLRPSMKTVILMLEGTIVTPFPPPPASLTNN